MTEVVALEEEFLSGRCRQRVCQAVTEVQLGGRAAAAPVAPICDARQANMIGGQRHDRDVQITQQRIELCPQGARAAVGDDARFRDRRGACATLRAEHGLDERRAFGLVEDDGQERRGVDDHRIARITGAVRCCRRDGRRR